MTEPLETYRLHAYVDGQLAPDEAAAVERALAGQPEAAAEVAALKAQKRALHDRYDAWLDAPHRFSIGGAWSTAASGRASRRSWSGGWLGAALASMLAIGLGIGIVTGWIAHGRTVAADAVASKPEPASNVADAGLMQFVKTAARSHAVFAPEVRHPVEVPASDEAHLVAWLSKRLQAPVTIPKLGNAGWNLLGGRLLPAEAGPVAQFMYQDARGRRLTLAVSHERKGVEGSARHPQPSFRIAEEGDDTVFYWIDADYAYALTGRLDRGEMTALADRVYHQLDPR